MAGFVAIVVSWTLVELFMLYAFVGADPGKRSRVSALAVTLWSLAGPGALLAVTLYKLLTQPGDH